MLKWRNWFRVIVTVLVLSLSIQGAVFAEPRDHFQDELQSQLDHLVEFNVITLERLT